MKKIFSLLLVISIVTFGVHANEKESLKVRGLIHASVGGINSVNFTVPGVSGAIGGSVEVPLNASAKWNVNVGLDFNYKYVTDQYVSISDAVAENNWTANMKHNMFFINVPVVFSYDFNIASNALLRLGFGVQYQQYLGGKSFCELDGETTSFLPTESHNLKNGSRYGQLLGMYSNAGGLLQLGFLINDVYVGVTYDAFFEGLGNWGYVGTVGARVGYRF